MAETGAGQLPAQQLPGGLAGEDPREPDEWTDPQGQLGSPQGLRDGGVVEPSDLSDSSQTAPDGIFATPNATEPDREGRDRDGCECGYEYLNHDYTLMVAMRRIAK